MEKEHNFSRKKIKTVSQIIPTIPILHGQHKKPALVAAGIPSTILVIFASILTLTPTIGAGLLSHYLVQTEMTTCVVQIIQTQSMEKVAMT